MTKTMSVLFVVTVLLSAAFVTSFGMQQADALKAKGTGLTKNTKGYGLSTASKVCGDKLCSEGQKRTLPKTEPRTGKISGGQEQPAMEKPMMEKPMMEKPIHKSTISSKTITSMQDPGLGHESHQLAIILPPSDVIYKGSLTYSTSEPVQLVSLTGPLAKGEDNGQPIWTPDGETKFALTIVDPQASSGTWNFAGNALAVHTKNPEQFTASYTVSYAEKETSGTVMTGTAISVQDPGLGHESHQLAVILPPNEMPYGGMLTYSASEPIQLVALHGPLAKGEDNGQPIWTPDGETKFALTIVDPQASSGTWNFAGNALAVHTKNPEPFTVTYTVVASQ
ncbi:MAG: hypothetical protein WAO91_01885 [Candidatus Nitrosotenuis sp.]